ncbi:MAG: translation initiation factor IF-3 [Bacilli bacterium]|nr:translation initiation factor IF-3 [Bacilli bacterium]MDY0063454.1 translation initiation factor IF-3 [Bacilli bacterium]
MSCISKNVDRKSDALVNENIEADVVLVIDENGTSLGEQSLQIAIKMAEARNLDLVCVAPNAKVPVCRFMDYSKYRYEMQRKAREAKKNQKIISIKEIRLTPVISSNDFETKLRNGMKFLEEGNKLKVTLTFNRRARMLNTGDPNFSVLDNYIARTEEIATVEQKPTLEGRNMSALLAPKKEKNR